MSLEKISNDDLAFLDTWYTPKALLEILFHDFDTLSSFDKERFGDLRLYQLPMVSDEGLIDFELTQKENNLSRKETFNLRKNVGDIYCFGARKFGKSMAVMILDMLFDMMTTEGTKVALGSVDLIHIKQVLDPVKICLENHKICSSFTRRIAGSPDFKIELKNNYTLNSVNANQGAKNVGGQWLGKHVYKLYLEEASLEDEAVYEKRKDALSELGAIFRVSGMCDFTPQSPAGQAFYSAENHKFVLNYPQFVNPYFDADEKKKRIEQYGGENSIGFRVYVLGEVVEDGLTAFDLQRVRQMAINESKSLKTVEITKDRYKHFKSFLILDRPVNAERIFISSDIGLNVTEINIISEVNGKYEYLYNVTLLNLIDNEQEEIFKYIIELLQANVISVDCGDGQGRALYNELAKTIPLENLVWYAGTNKVITGFLENKNGEIIIENGKPVVKEEFMSEWSVSRLKYLLYNGLLLIPEDFKFITQISKVVATKSGDRTIYKCLAEQGDHLFDSFKVFCIGEWMKNNASLTPKIKDNWGTGAVN